MNKSEENQTKAVSTVIEEGIPFAVTVNNPKWYHGLPYFPKRREFIIYPINLGTLLRMSKVIMSIDEIDVNNEMTDFFGKVIESIVNNTEKVSEIVAFAVTNSEEPPPRRLIKFLRANLSSKEIFQILKAVIKQMDVQDFFYFITSLRGVNILKKMKAETIKTSGEQSDQSLNTTDSVGTKSSGGEVG